MKKKFKKNKNLNQKSFYFEDYLETNKKNKILKKSKNFQDRIYLLFFLFFSLIFIFSIRIIHVSLNSIELFNQENQTKKFTQSRRDIVDRNGTLISRNIKFYHAAIKPTLIKNKDNFLINLRVNFPELNIKKINENLEKGKYFYLKKRLSQDEKDDTDGDGLPNGIEFTVGTNPTVKDTDEDIEALWKKQLPSRGVINISSLIEK